MPMSLSAMLIASPIPRVPPVTIATRANTRTANAAREGAAVYAGGKQVGTVTSGAFSPTLGHPIAMAYVNAGQADEGTELELEVRGKRLPAPIKRTVSPRAPLGIDQRSTVRVRGNALLEGLEQVRAQVTAPVDSWWR